MRDVYTDQQVLDILRSVVTEFGSDYVYERRMDWDDSDSGCDYVRDGKPSCIVAQVATRMGATVGWLSQVEDVGAVDVCGFGDHPLITTEVITSRPFSVSLRAAIALGCAQNAQNAGATWGEALRVAESSLS